MALAHDLDSRVSSAERDTELAGLERRLDALRVVIEDAILERHQTRKQITVLRMRVAPCVGPGRADVNRGRSLAMKTLEWKTIDKTTWGPGEWQDEPDKRQWQDPATGLACLAVRNESSGNWCGYVGVPPGHPYHGISYSGCTRKPPCDESYCGHSPDVDVHGGLTFADTCHKDEDDPSRFICHLPEPGEPEKVWWFGFDCHHHMDFAPAYASRYRDHPILGARDSGETYRTLGYVERECTRLAAQLIAAKPTSAASATPGAREERNA